MLRAITPLRFYSVNLRNRNKQKSPSGKEGTDCLKNKLGDTFNLKE